MGFDVTFHPIGRDQLDHYFFDVLADPALGRERSREISADPERQAVVLQLYRAFPRFRAMNQPVGSSFAFGAAILAGFLHPFWYARGQGFSMLPRSRVPEAAGLFVPIGQITASKLTGLPDPSHGLIRGNTSASGFMPPHKVAEAEALLGSLAERVGDDGRPLLEAFFDEDGLGSLHAALRYCREHDLGMFEASDVVVPLSNECYTDHANMRAPFLGKLEP